MIIDGDTGHEIDCRLTLVFALTATFTWPILLLMDIMAFIDIDEDPPLYIKIAYVILIPLWIVLSPIGIPISVILLICYKKR